MSPIRCCLGWVQVWQGLDFRALGLKGLSIVGLQSFVLKLGLSVSHCKLQTKTEVVQAFRHQSVSTRNKAESRDIWLALSPGLRVFGLFLARVSGVRGCGFRL